MQIVFTLIVIGIQLLEAKKSLAYKYRDESIDMARQRQPSIYSYAPYDYSNVLSEDYVGETSRPPTIPAHYNKKRARHPNQHHNPNIFEPDASNRHFNVYTYYNREKRDSPDIRLVQLWMRNWYNLGKKPVILKRKDEFISRSTAKADYREKNRNEDNSRLDFNHHREFSDDHDNSIFEPERMLHPEAIYREQRMFQKFDNAYPQNQTRFGKEVENAKLSIPSKHQPWERYPEIVRNSTGLLNKSNDMAKNRNKKGRIVIELEFSRPSKREQSMGNETLVSMFGETKSNSIDQTKYLDRKEQQQFSRHQRIATETTEDELRQKNLAIPPYPYQARGDDERRDRFEHQQAVFDPKFPLEKAMLDQNYIRGKDRGYNQQYSNMKEREKALLLDEQLAKLLDQFLKVEHASSLLESERYYRLAKSIQPLKGISHIEWLNNILRLGGLTRKQVYIVSPEGGDADYRKSHLDHYANSRYKDDNQRMVDVVAELLRCDNLDVARAGISDLDQWKQVLSTITAAAVNLQAKRNADDYGHQQYAKRRRHDSREKCKDAIIMVDRLPEELVSDMLVEAERTLTILVVGDPERIAWDFRHNHRMEHPHPKYPTNPLCHLLFGRDDLSTEDMIERLDQLLSGGNAIFALTGSEHVESTRLLLEYHLGLVNIFNTPSFEPSLKSSSSLSSFYIREKMMSIDQKDSGSYEYRTMDRAWSAAFAKEHAADMAVYKVIQAIFEQDVARVFWIENQLDR